MSAYCPLQQLEEVSPLSHRNPSMLTTFLEAFCSFSAWFPCETVSSPTPPPQPLGCARSSPARSQYMQLYLQNDFCPPSGHQISRSAGYDCIHFHAITSHPWHGAEIPQLVSHIFWALNLCGYPFELKSRTVYLLTCILPREGRATFPACRGV